MREQHDGQQSDAQFWDRVASEELLAIMPCMNADTEFQAGMSLLNSKFRLRVRTGSSEQGTEQFFVLGADDADAVDFWELISKVQTRFCLPTVRAEGFDITLSLPANFHHFADVIVHRPFEVKTSTESTPDGHVVLSYDSMRSNQPTRSEWISLLESAYAEMRNYGSFTFEGGCS